ncbi:MAG: hypothetical protein K5873_03075 [Treponema sp.]|nr:hypothetical protein [Treponema sp.]
MKKVMLCLAAFLFASLSAFAQSSELLTTIIQSEKATAAQISYLPALYAELINEEESSNDKNFNRAFFALQSKGIFAEDAAADSEITLAQTCYAYTKILKIKGGLFYSLFPSPRYAFKELKAKGILPPTADPSMNLSGRESLDLFNSCLNYAGGTK